MELFGKKINSNESEISLDYLKPNSLVWPYSVETAEIALSPRQDKAINDKSPDKAMEREERTIICDEFWSDFLLMCRVCYLRDPDADLYDVFETIRTKLLGGWGFTDSYLAKLDAEIAKEEARARRRAV